MPYTWTTEALLLTTHHWVEYAAFMRIIGSFKFKQFSVKAVRDSMLTTLANLEYDTPFNVTTRFPEDKIYIDLSHSVPLKILQQLTKALDFSDRQTEKGRVTTDQEKNRTHSNFEDAKVAFYTAVDQLIDLIGPFPIEAAHVYGVYTRTSFEIEKGLVWA
ncbi:hypothetical protein [Hubei virga-like virus 11]|uniref:hypothetical protein n=1 Tax=Hubei virga-like virus 11 TaxID=1923326 RepID=UPI00090A2B6D|nr:hypothetical protein [Hubei virga-like virus 11]APG77620.1 hypothetical protein [Hubei virga-like virus 11]QIJ70144.1 putative protein 3 [Hubei virga-like virus 11]